MYVYIYIYYQYLCLWLKPNATKTVVEMENNVNGTFRSLQEKIQIRFEQRNSGCFFKVKSLKSPAEFSLRLWICSAAGQPPQRAWAPQGLDAGLGCCCGHRRTMPPHSSFGLEASRAPRAGCLLCPKDSRGQRWPRAPSSSGTWGGVLGGVLSQEGGIKGRLLGWWERQIFCSWGSFGKVRREAARMEIVNRPSGTLLDFL